MNALLITLNKLYFLKYSGEKLYEESNRVLNEFGKISPLKPIPPPQDSSTVKCLDRRIFQNQFV